MNQLRTKEKIGMGKDKHRTIENIGVHIGASCHEVIPDSRPDLGAEHSIRTKKSLGPRAQFMNYNCLMNIFLSEHCQGLCSKVKVALF